MTDITGNKYGRLTVIKFDHYNKFNNPYWLCECECGNKKSIRESLLKNGKTLSCGCYQKEKSTKHGMRNKKLYNVLEGIKSRCLNPKNNYFYLYGARGIKVCEEWCSDREKFFSWALENGYKEGLSIDRIDVNGDYCPENCRWVNYTTQGRNKRTNSLYEYNNETHCLSEWAEIYNINPHNLRTRLKNGWDFIKALTTPYKKYKTKEFRND